MTTHTPEPTGMFEESDGHRWYRIDDYDSMAPFLMSIVSSSDHWMYVSSSGALTAGRGSADHSLFAYRTDDLLHRFNALTGPYTGMKVMRDGASTLWEPFSTRDSGPDVTRSLAKPIEGDAVIFIERNARLRATFSYRLATSDAFGFVRTSTLEFWDDESVHVELLDGFLDIMPPNVVLGLVQSSSTLVDAYRRNELVDDLPLALFTLEAAITDRAEPRESLDANIAWSYGLDRARPVLSPAAVDDFVNGRPIDHAALLTGTRASFLIHDDVHIAGEPLEWTIVADVHQSHLAVEQLRAFLRADVDHAADVEADIDRGHSRLRDLVRSADGEQATADPMAVSHHFANTLFNCMRGGVLLNDGAVEPSAFTDFVGSWNRHVADRHAEWLGTLDASVPHHRMGRLCAERNDPDLERLFLEYLPITFGRRHGDPSRPWNSFHIKVTDDVGEPIIAYQGNWRDIFQNWEALGYSFPDYIESFVTKFVNASTADGHNPYRLSEAGIDWEVPEPDNPWSNIGYWGDHQIVYLLRLLEAWARFAPGELEARFTEPIYTYADVPYRIAPWTDLIADPRSSIAFDALADRAASTRAADIGADGRLLRASGGAIAKANLAEKLLVPALAKVSNLVVGGGIWLNTQRPEWNDANNALAGYGLSVVTTGHLHRYLQFLAERFERTDLDGIEMTAEVATWMSDVTEVLRSHAALLEADGAIDDETRFTVLEGLGLCYSAYRAAVYDGGPSSGVPVPGSIVTEFLALAKRFTRHTVEANRRDDGLYHSYNVLDLDAAGLARVSHLPLMLEGQVSVLGSAVLDPEQAATLMEALFDSSLYRPDQNSFLLYPKVELPGFLDRNRLDDEHVEGSELLTGLIAAGDRSIVGRDAFGTYRFAAGLTSHDELREALERLGSDPRWTDLVSTDEDRVHDAYESAFDHQRFTGRSASMYKYEGLGSIYWHQVAKLLLASQEAFWQAHDGGSSDELLDRLASVYYRIRSGLSSDKTPAEYGAFPMDPYSHTPAHLGAQQPGMTGQVKEELLTRFGEFGVRFTDGRISFVPSLLRAGELFAEPTTWLRGTHEIDLPAGSLAFSIGDVPVIYEVSPGEPSIDVTWADGSVTTLAGSHLDRDTSASLFRRSGDATGIRVRIEPGSLPTSADA